jgi:hypothetical protein
MVSRENLRLLLKQGDKKPVNRVWEFRVGLAAGLFGLAPRLHGEHENPDVSFFWQGDRWGVECLVLHTPKEDTWLQRVAEKADQLEDISTNRGFIAVDVSNIIARSKFVDALADFRARRTRSEMEQVMVGELNRVARHVDKRSFWLDTRRQRLAGLLLHADTVTAFDGRLAQLGRAHIILREDDRAVGETAARLMSGVGT